MTTQQNPPCPKCNGPTVERQRRDGTGSFYGCKKFPRCKGIANKPGDNGRRRFRRKVNNDLKPIPVRPIQFIETPSDYQHAIFDKIENIAKKRIIELVRNIIVIATAGSGKTAVCEHIVGLLKKIDPTLDIIYLVYNTRVAREAASKGLPAKTTHSKFFADYRAWMKSGRRGRVNVDEYKVSNIVYGLLEDDYGPQLREFKWMIHPVKKIVGLVKNTLCDTDNESLDELTRKYPGIELNDSQYEIFELVRRTMKISNKDLNTIDFDDMLWMPHYHNIPIEKFDWVLGDEVQDWNAVQIALIEKTVKPTGHVVIVGDRNQSMYGFRGAAVNSIDILQEAFDAQELPLSISYRNPKSHVALVNETFPNINHEAWENAIEGEIMRKDFQAGCDAMVDGDLVLCRVNAPLIKPAFALLREGRKVVILGRDIAANLINLIEMHRQSNLNKTLHALGIYARDEYEKLMQRGRTMQAEAISDKINTINAIAEECKTVDEVIGRIDTIFSDDLEGVTFSSVHKAKGSEARNVHILTEGEMPHPMAQTEDEMRQEQNIRFVAYTRAKENLTFVLPEPKN